MERENVTTVYWSKGEKYDLGSLCSKMPGMLLAWYQEAGCSETQMNTWSTDAVRDCGSINRSFTVTSKGYAGGGLLPPDNMIWLWWRAAMHMNDSVTDSWHSSEEGKKKKTQHTASVDNEFKGNNFWFLRSPGELLNPV